MQQSKDEINEELAHQRELLRKRRANLRKMQLREADQGGTPTLELMNQLDRLEEQVRESEAMIARLETEAATDTLPLSELAYRRLLAEAWDGIEPPLWRPKFVVQTRLDEERLRLAILPEQAQEIEKEVRAKLAEEAFPDDFHITYEPEHALGRHISHKIDLINQISEEERNELLRAFTDGKHIVIVIEGKNSFFDFRKSVALDYRFAAQIFIDVAKEFPHLSSIIIDSLRRFRHTAYNEYQLFLALVQTAI